MDVREAAKVLGVHTQTVYNMLYDGRLKGRKTESGAWDIDRESVYRVLSKAAGGAAVAEVQQMLWTQANKREITIVERLQELCADFLRTDDAFIRGDIVNRILEAAKELEGLEASMKVIDALMDEAIDRLSVLDSVDTRGDK